MSHDDALEPKENAEPDMTPSLVARLRGGDPKAGELLDQLYREALVRFCWGYLGQMEEAEDSVQDICCKVLSTDEIPEAFRPWLYRIARNHCLNLLRSRARRLDDHKLPSASQLREVLTGQLTRLVRDEQKARLEELVLALPELQREVLRLRYVEGLTRPEIAQVLEVDESVVKSRLFEGLQRLRDQSASES